MVTHVLYTRRHGDSTVKILSFKAGHDGHIVYVRDSELIFSFEAEKDSKARYAGLSPEHYLRAFEYVPDFPDVVALSGWFEGPGDVRTSVGSGYYGIDAVSSTDQTFLGRKIKTFSSSHERAHVMCSYGLSPWPQGQPCYALVYEGNIGAFYYVDSEVRIHKIGDVLSYPGRRYAFLYALADPKYAPERTTLRAEDPGKLMALAAYGRAGTASPQQRELIDIVLNADVESIPNPKAHLSNSPYFNIGVESQEFKDLARVHSEEILRRFMDYAKENLQTGLPLLISGGCGLNCDWNSAWRSSGQFSDVFVPPCTNDMGAGIGTAIDAMHFYSGEAKLRWNVYAGEEFLFDDADLSAFEATPLDYQHIAKCLHNGDVLAWVQGRCEIGPRALGNRSLLASASSADMRIRLNRIKNREMFRPIAPVCLEEDLSKLFSPATASPYMLFFQEVLSDTIPAVTHVDGTARSQSVTEEQNPALHRLLSEFKTISGLGVLCNTSLNFSGAGFINRLSDLVRYVYEHDIDGFVVASTFYRRRLPRKL